MLAEAIKWVLISITCDDVIQLSLVSEIGIKIIVCKDYAFEKQPIVILQAENQKNEISIKSRQLKL